MISPAKRIANVGEYYFSRKLAQVRALDSPSLPVINLGIGSPDMAPSPDVVDTLAASARDASAHGYQSYRGAPQLRQAIAAFCAGRYGVALDPESMILPLMGSKEGILHISMAFVDEGDEVLIPDPGYPTYASVTTLAGAKIRTYAMREELGWGIDIDALERSDLSRVKLMWINFPHMPTGRVATRDELARLVALARRNDFLLVNDNPYSLILNDEPMSLLSIDGASDVALELNSLSKSHNMAGWRIGWLAGRRDYVDAVLRVRSNMDSGTFLPMQLAAAKALALPQGWFDALNQTYAARRERARALLDSLGCSYDESQAGLFVWAKAPDSVVDVEAWLDEILNATHVFITPGVIFGEAGRRFVRVSLCSPESVIDEAAARIAAFVNDKTELEGASTPDIARADSRSRGAFATSRRGVSPRRVVKTLIVGLGLIGGSIAIDLRRAGLASQIVGADASPEHCRIALERGLVDEVAPLHEAAGSADVVIIAIPVDAIRTLVPDLLDRVRDDAVVIDAGSTKSSICQAVASHPRRAQFVAAHPIAGTENSGPDAAIPDLFAGKVNIICERERSGERALDVAAAIFDALRMRTTFMTAEEHDLHLAYVSHLSHVSSFLLGQTVLDIENDEKAIFNLAGSGFASTVRLAKSSPAMWVPIFEQNAPALTRALDEYIAHIQAFRRALADGYKPALFSITTRANEIRRVLSTLGNGPAPTEPLKSGQRTSSRREREALEEKSAEGSAVSQQISPRFARRDDVDSFARRDDAAHSDNVHAPSFRRERGALEEKSAEEANPSQQISPRCARRDDVDSFARPDDESSNPTLTSGDLS